MDPSSILRVVLILGGGLLVYDWLKNSGMLGGTVTATSTAPSSTTTAPIAPTSTAPAIDQNLANQLTQAMQNSVSRSVGTISEWNWEYTHVKGDPNAPTLVGATPAEQQANYGLTQQISVEQYLELRSAAGLSGLYRGFVVERPMSRYVN